MQLVFLCVWVNECSSGFRQAELAPSGVQLRWVPAIGCMSLATQPSPQPPGNLKLADGLTQALSILLMLTATEQDLQLLREMAGQGTGEFRPVPNGTQELMLHQLNTWGAQVIFGMWESCRWLLLIVVECCWMLSNVVVCWKLLKVFLKKSTLKSCLTQMCKVQSFHFTSPTSSPGHRAWNLWTERLLNIW